LLQAPGNFANQLQGRTSQIDLGDEKAYWKEIVTNGTPSKEELLTELKNFFEGPINLDLMILGSLKNIL
jgi:hypothetical protein